jgi:membrane protein DedA with SNARE-associated domain
MRALLLASLIVALPNASSVEAWMAQAFYPVLLGILVVASLGLPIPEDIPLIAAGVLLKTTPGVATWPGTVGVALLGIMSGDLVLYTLGRRWGRDVITHRSVNWLITPRLFEKAVDSFQRRGMWYCFFGRFFMGIRAVMCITAGATRYPYWKFFIADFCGALLSVPLFIGLGYAFADMLPTLRGYMANVEWVLLGLLGVGIALYVYFEIRKHRRMRAESERVAREQALVAPPPEKHPNPAPRAEPAKPGPGLPPRSAPAKS